jgi:hypothetical protein
MDWDCRRDLDARLYITPSNNAVMPAVIFDFGNVVAFSDERGRPHRRRGNSCGRRKPDRTYLGHLKVASAYYFFRRSGAGDG